MDLNGWDFAIIASKWFVYIGVAATVGGPFSLLLIRDNKLRIQPIRAYVLVAALAGLVASILGFYLQVGLLVDKGLAGVFDDLYQRILWSSSVGNSTLARTTGFAMIIAASLLAARAREASESIASDSRTLMGAAIYFLGVSLLVYSFTPVGHTAALHWTYCLTLAAHVALVGWWLGSLWPLHLACSSLSTESLHRVMQNFGRIALILVLILIAGGVAVAFQLFSSLTELLSTNYGRVFTVKLVLVAGLLLLALWHKTRLVPALVHSKHGAARLAKSIRIEMAIGCGVLLVTAFLTTAVGPSHGM